MSSISISQSLRRKKLVFIFNKFDSNDVIFVTPSDDVYGYGTNFSGRLGLGLSDFVPNPTIIPELCGKGVTKIEFGYYFMVALTEALEVYTCGYDKYGYLGFGENTKEYYRPTKLVLRDGKLVTNIKCCVYSTYLLTETKDVYRFGYLQNGTVAEKPTAVDFPNNDKIFSISCGYNHCMALTEDGRVYSWGLIDTGIDPQLIPEFDWEKQLINQISCGDYHSLLLTTDGKVYAFGYNDCGQLGTGDTNKQMTPTMIDTFIEFVWIFATKQMSMAFTKDNYTFIWGESRNIKFINCALKVPMETFEEAVRTFSPNTYSYKTLSSKELVEKKRMNRMMQTMTKAFNNQKNSDLKFKLKHKDSEKFDLIYVHKWIVEENCEHFQKMFANNWSETKTNEIQINDFSYEGYYQFLRCLYTDYIQTKDIEILIEVMAISDLYLEEEIKTKCVKIIKRLIKLQNVCTLYSCALRNRSKELEDFCFEFMTKNIDSLTKSEDYKRMDSNYAKDFLTKFSQLLL